MLLSCFSASSPAAVRAFTRGCDLSIGRFQMTEPLDPRFPLGKFQAPVSIDAGIRSAMIGQIAEVPSQVRGVLKGLPDLALDTPYRDGGWTVRQVVHHMADSHINAFVRFRLALTEQEPLVKTYDEKAWAELPDSRLGALDPSLSILDGVHERWAAFLRAAPADSFARCFRHPDHGLRSLDFLLALYSWHGRHHVAHIRNLRSARGW
jgi:hypothetical protein